MYLIRRERERKKQLKGTVGKRYLKKFNSVAKSIELKIEDDHVKCVILRLIEMVILRCASLLAPNNNDKKNTA